MSTSSLSNEEIQQLRECLLNVGNESGESDANLLLARYRDPGNVDRDLQQWSDRLMSTRSLSNAELEQLHECLLNVGNESRGNRRGSGENGGWESEYSREELEAAREELEERLQRWEMGNRVEDEDQEYVGLHDGDGHDGGSSGGNGGGDGGHRGVHDGYDCSSDEDARELHEARKEFIDTIDAYTNKRLAEEEHATRLEELAKDPAKGGRVDDKTRREAEVALQLEEMGLLAGPIRRDPSGDAEFIDRRGMLWDVKQFHSENGWFDLREAVKTIRGELLAGENVILDTKFLDSNDAAALRSVIEANGWQRKILWSKDE